MYSRRKCSGHFSSARRIAGAERDDPIAARARRV
jgi:hypothetical protein